MAIALEFLDLVVPIRIIEAKYPGGWDQCRANHRPQIGRTVWFDEHLFRDGTMGPQDMEELVARWSDMGFETKARVDGQLVWRDVCVVEAMLQGPTLPCDWIEVGDDSRIAWLKGTEPGEVAGRD